jgi:hypothetical protein
MQSLGLVEPAKLGVFNQILGGKDAAIHHTPHACAQKLGRNNRATNVEIGIRSLQRIGPHGPA